MKNTGGAEARIKIVVVDDHDLVREGLRLWLNGMPAMQQVGEARNLMEALTVIRNENPSIVLMDLVLPGPSGLDGAEQIGREFPDVKVILLTSYCEEEYVHRALRAGAYGYVIKDVGYNDLETALTAVSQGALYLSPAASHCMAKMEFGAQEKAQTPETLTRRQREILTLLAEGHTVKSVGHHLGISAKTVDMHKSRLMQRLGISNIPSLVRYAIQQKLVKL